MFLVLSSGVAAGTILSNLWKAAIVGEGDEGSATARLAVHVSIAKRAIAPIQVTPDLTMRLARRQ